MDDLASRELAAGFVTEARKPEIEVTNIAGESLASENVSTHGGGTLDGNDLEGKQIACP